MMKNSVNQCQTVKLYTLVELKLKFILRMELKKREKKVKLQVSLNNMV